MPTFQKLTMETSAFEANNAYFSHVASSYLLLLQLTRLILSNSNVDTLQRTISYQGKKKDCKVSYTSALLLRGPWGPWYQYCIIPKSMLWRKSPNLAHKQMLKSIGTLYFSWLLAHHGVSQIKFWTRLQVASEMAVDACCKAARFLFVAKAFSYKLDVDNKTKNSG